MGKIFTEDPRGQVRFRTYFQAHLIGEQCEIEATVTNLSLSGLQLECGQQAISRLMPNKTKGNRQTPINIHVHFQVPTSSQSRADINLKCLIIYTRRQAQDRYLIGAQFSLFEHHCEVTLQDYIAHFGERL